MTNFEKYKDEILSIIKRGIAIALENGKPKPCTCVECSQCGFHTFDEVCRFNLVKWLYEEYKEPAPKLTAKERAFCEVVSVYPNRYIARNNNGNLALYCGNVTKDGDYWDGYDVFIGISKMLFPFIKREDEAPWSIDDLLGLEVE